MQCSVPIYSASESQRMRPREVVRVIRERGRRHALVPRFLVGYSELRHLFRRDVPVGRALQDEHRHRLRHPTRRGKRIVLQEESIPAIVRRAVVMCPNTSSLTCAGGDP